MSPMRLGFQVVIQLFIILCHGSCCFEAYVDHLLALVDCLRAQQTDKQVPRP